MAQTQQQQMQIALNFIEDQMYAAIRKLTPEKQAELRALSASQSLAEFTRTLQQRFSEQAQYITETRVDHVMAYDRQQRQTWIPDLPALVSQQESARPQPGNQPAPAPTPAPAPALTRQPARATSQPKQQKKRGFVYSFKRSTWITSIWNWFLMLAGKAAEPVLTLSVIYSCARLLPAIHTPVQVDNLVFICQMIALDIGGLGLRKLANQAKKDNNPEGAQLAGRVSTALLTIMGINVALSVLSSVAPIDPTIEKVIEGILLIARSIMAVFYAYVIHNLNGESQSQGEPHNDLPPQPGLPNIEQMMDQKLDTWSARLMQDFQNQQRDMLASMPQPQSVDPEAIIAGVVERFEGRFTSAMKHLDAEVEQRVRVATERETQQMKLSSGTNGTAIAGPHLVPLPQRSSSTQSMKPLPTEEHQATSASQSQGETNESADPKSRVYALLNEDNTRQVADLMQTTGLPKTTVWRHWRRYHEEHGTRGLAQIVVGSSESQPESETA
jgi:hypothetical protein